MIKTPEYVLGHARTITGWMGDAELLWLHDRAAGKRFVVELGAWCGRSSVALSSAQNLLCVDTWAGSEEHAGTIASGFDPWGEWVENTRRYPGIRHLRCDLAGDISGLVAEVQSRGLADMVFVDAAHDYESACRDIATARKLLRPGGLLCGHDYSDSWPSVVRAVDELVPRPVVHISIWSAS